MSVVSDVFPKVPQKEYEFHIRKPYSRTRTPISFEGVQSVTDASYGNDTDVNKIIARCRRTGEALPDNGPGQYMDCTDLQEDLTVLIDKAKKTLVDYEAQIAKQKEQETKQLQENAEKARQFDELQKKQAEILKPTE